MSKSNRKSAKKSSHNQRGQILVLVAAAALGIIAIVGLVMDVGLMFIGNARLRRAVDAAALAAALQYREGVQTTTLTDSATEFLIMNGVTLDASHPVTVDTCLSDASLCTDANGNYVARKLVRVRASATVSLAFLPVIGIDSVPITAEATSETASLDLVLVIDTSESMTFDAPLPVDDINRSYLRDPSICNDDQKTIAAVNASALSPADKAALLANIQADVATYGLPGYCYPFNNVLKAALDFVKTELYFPYDHVAIVTFDKSAHNVLEFRNDCTDPSGICTTDQIKANVENAIRNLQVYPAEDVCDAGQPCRPYCTLAMIKAGYCDSQPADVVNFLDPSHHPDAVYKGNFDCGNGWYFDPNNLQDPSGCTTTDIGDGLLVAGDMFSSSSGGDANALWVTILLTDGSANAGTSTNGNPVCPLSTWNPQYTPLCRDSSSDTRHCALADTRARCIDIGNGLPVNPDNLSGIYKPGVWDPANYDADDYARDMADFVTLDQQSLLFSIGLGNQVNLPSGDPAGARLLQYAAERVWPRVTPTVEGSGLYYFAPSTTQLAAIFKKIGDNIATRLAR